MASTSPGGVLEAMSAEGKIDLARLREFLSLHHARGRERIVANDLRAGKAPGQVQVQRFIEFEDQQVVGGDAAGQQRFGEHAGAAAEFDDLAGPVRQLAEHFRRQFLAAGRHRGRRQGCLQPLPKKRPGNGRVVAALAQDTPDLGSA